MSPRVALGWAADVAELLWSAVLTLAGCTALAWMGYRVMLAILESGGTEVTATFVFSVVLVVDVAWIVAWAVRQRKKWARDRVWVKTR